MLSPALAVLLVVPAADPVAGAPGYYKDVRPILQQHCQGCHQPAKPSGEVVLTRFDALLAKDASGTALVVPGKPDQSELLKEIVPHNGKPAKMPKDAPPLSEEQIAKVRKWIAAGASDDTPASAKAAVVDAAHPPTYVSSPVIPSLDFSPDGALLAVAGYHEILLHKGDGSGLVARLIGASERIGSVAFSPDGRSLAAVGGNPGRVGEVQIWDVAKRELRLAVTFTFDTLNGLSWSPDGALVAFGCNDNTLRAIDSKTGKQVLFQGAHNDWVLDTAFSSDSKFLVSASRDRTLKLVEVGTQRFIDNVTSITPGALKGGLAAVARRPFKEKKIVKATNIEVSSTEEKIYEELLIGGSDGQPKLYKMHREAKRVIGDDANKVREYEKRPGRIYALAFDADGARFAVGSSHDGTGEVRVYQTGDAKFVAAMAGQKGAVYAVRFHPNGKVLASTGFDGMVRLNDPATGKLIQEFVPIPATAKVAAK